MRSAAPAQVPHPTPRSRTHRSRSCHWRWRPSAPWGPGLTAPEVRGSWAGCRDLSQRGSGTVSRRGPNPGVGRVTRAPKGRVLGGGVTLCLGQHRRWGINSGAGAHAVLGCDRSWVPATSHRPVPGARERGRVPRARLSGMPAPTCGKVDTLRMAQSKPQVEVSKKGLRT